MGYNDYSQGTTSILSIGAVKAAAGGHHSLFVKTDGTLWAVGYNGWGQLGDGTTTNRSTPVQVASGVLQAASGGTPQMACIALFVMTEGTLWAMGYNNYGELGDGTTANRSFPVQVATGVAQIAVGGNHSLFVKTDGTLWAMGYNRLGPAWRRHHHAADHTGASGPLGCRKSRQAAIPLTAAIAFS